jgi:hypothetical protein
VFTLVNSIFRQEALPLANSLSTIDNTRFYDVYTAYVAFCVLSQFLPNGRECREHLFQGVMK